MHFENLWFRTWDLGVKSPATFLCLNPPYTVDHYLKYFLRPIEMGLQNESLVARFTGSRILDDIQCKTSPRSVE
jgi:hypothetical protein